MKNILFEDNHLLAVVKPPMCPTQPTPTGEKSLEDMAKAYIKEKYQKPGNVFLHAVHRLDKAASGIVLFAKTSKALSRLQEMMREYTIEKEYLALVEGALKKKSGTLEHLLLHGDHRALVHPDGKKSVLHYEVIEEGNNSSLLRIQLITGRYHQIRAQLAHIGHPIIGDSKYGSHVPFQHGICLFHNKMQFLHPVTKEKTIIDLPAPTSWLKLN